MVPLYGSLISVCIVDVLLGFVGFYVVQQFCFQFNGIFTNRNMQYFDHQVAAEQTDPVLAMQLTDMFTEQQEDTATKTQATEEKIQSVTTDRSTVAQ